MKKAAGPWRCRLTRSMLRLEDQPNSLRNVDLEGFAHRALDVAISQATAPAKNEGAPFIGIFHEESPKRYGHYLCVLDNQPECT